MLVGSRPMLVVPTNVEFHGNIWDEKKSRLVFTLEGNGRAEVEIRNCTRPKRISPEAEIHYNPEKRTATLKLELGGRKKVAVYF